MYGNGMVSDLGLRFDRYQESEFRRGEDRWTAEIRSSRRKHKSTAEIKGAKCGNSTAEIKGNHSKDIRTVEINGPKSAACQSSRMSICQVCG